MKLLHALIPALFLLLVAESTATPAEADRIRKALSDMGVVLKDSAQGTQWERA